MEGIPQWIQTHPIQHFCKAHPAYGTGVAKGLGLNIQNIIEGPQDDSR